MIVNALIAAAACAALFVLFGLLRPGRRCSGSCGRCVGPCELKDRET